MIKLNENELNNQIINDNTFKDFKIEKMNNIKLYNIFKIINIIKLKK